MLRSPFARWSGFFGLVGVLAAGEAASPAGGVVVLPQFAVPLVGRTAAGGSIGELDVFAVPVQSVAQEQEAYVATQAGLGRALDEADPGAAIDYLAGYLAVLRSAEQRAARTPGEALPARDRFRGLLEQRAEEAWREGRHGSALLAWVLRDRVAALPGEMRDLVETSVDANHGWALWRRRVLADVRAVVPPTEGIGSLGWIIPTWAPVLRHPRAWFDRQPRPLPEVREIATLSGPLREDLAPKSGPAPAVRLRLKVSAPREITGPRHQEVNDDWITRQLNKNYFADEAAHRAKLQDFDRRIAAAQERADREAPKITKTERVRKFVGYEERAMFQQALPFGAKPPGVQQGDLYRSGSVRVPVYEDTMVTREVPNPDHPLNVAVRDLAEQRLVLVQRGGPAAVTGGVQIEYQKLDQWLGSIDVPLEVEAGTGPERFVLRVPVIRVEVRPHGSKSAKLDGARADWLAAAQDPNGLGAVEVHRAVATWWNFRRLEKRLGPELAAREAALLGELFFGLQPEEGAVIQRIREMFPQTAPKPNAADAVPGLPQPELWTAGTAPRTLAEPGAPAFSGDWPVPEGAESGRSVPPGDFRLVHDPAVEREARLLARRLGAAGLSVTLEARRLPRTAPLFPLLAFPKSRAADLGALLWRTVPEQFPAVHEDAAAARELRLHAPVEQRNFVEGMAWILAHPSRFAEALTLARRLRSHGGADTLVEITVSTRGVIRDGRPARSIHAPDPENRWLRGALEAAGLADCLPTEPLRLPPRKWAPADLVVVLRGEPGAAPRGLPEETVRVLGENGDKLLLFVNGVPRVVDASATADASLPLW